LFSVSLLYFGINGFYILFIKVLEWITISDLQLSCQSQSYFTTEGLPPVHLGIKLLEVHDQKSFFFQLSPWSNSPYVISSLMRRCIWMVVCLTTGKFKPLIFYWLLQLSWCYLIYIKMLLSCFLLQTCYKTCTNLHAGYLASQERLCSVKLVTFINAMVVQLRRFWLEGQTNAYSILVVKPFWGWILGEMRYRWENEGMNWIEQVQVYVQWGLPLDCITTCDINNARPSSSVHLSSLIKCV
jgi:hypothetical protein